NGLAARDGDLLDLLGGSQVPDSNIPTDGSANEGLAVRRYGGIKEALFRTVEGFQLRTGPPVPTTDHLVPAGTEQRLAVGRKGQGAHDAVVAEAQRAQPEDRTLWQHVAQLILEDLVLLACLGRNWFFQGRLLSILRRVRHRRHWVCQQAERANQGQQARGER